MTKIGCVNHDCDKCQAKPIGWLRILGRNVYFSREEPTEKIGIKIPVSIFLGWTGK